MMWDVRRSDASDRQAHEADVQDPRNVHTQQCDRERQCQRLTPCPPSLSVRYQVLRFGRLDRLLDDLAFEACQLLSDGVPLDRSGRRQADAT